MLSGLTASAIDYLLSTDAVVEASWEAVEVLTVTMVRTVLFVVSDDVDPFSTDSTVGVSDESKKMEDVAVNAMTGT